MLFLAPLIAAAGFVLFCVGMVAFLLDEDRWYQRWHRRLRLSRSAAREDLGTVSRSSKARQRSPKRTRAARSPQPRRA